MAAASGIIGALRQVATRALDVLRREIFGRDYFVSYARRDAARYAARLAKLLSERHSVYLDQLDIPRGAELPPRLRHALRGATMLVLVGSRDAVKSNSIRDELTLFLAMHRPTLLVDIDRSLDGAPWSETPWAALAGVYRQPESQSAFDAAEVSPEVLEYIRDSFNYTRQNRRLRRDTLLAACFLVAAMAGAAWFWRAANSASTQAAASVDEARVADQSRANAEKRTAAAMVQMGELTTAVNGAEARVLIAQDDAAEARKMEAGALANAEVQQHIAMSRRLAGEASERLARQPDLSMLLAAHALDAYPTAEARRALFDTVARSPAHVAIARDAHGTDIYRAAASADGRLLATRDKHGGTVLWDVKTRQHVPVIPPLREQGHAYNLGSLAFSSSRSLLAVSQRGVRPAGPVELWSTLDRRRMGTVPTSGDLVGFVSERTLAIGSSSVFFGPGNDSVSFWDVSDPSSPFQLPDRFAASGNIRGLAADPTRGLLVLQDRDGVMVCRAPCGKGDRLPYDSSEGGLLSGLALSLDDRSLVAAASEDNAVEVWYAARPEQHSFTVRPELPAPPDVANASLAFSADGEQLAIAREGGIVVLELFSRPDDEPIRQRVIPYGPEIVAMAFVADGLLAVAQANGVVAFVDSARLVASARAYGVPAEISSARFRNFGFSGNHGRLLMTRDRQMALWTPGVDSAPLPLPDAFGGEIWTVAASDDGEAIAAAGTERARSRESTVIVWDADGRERSRPLRSVEGAVRSLTFVGSAKERRLAVLLATGSLSVYDVTNLDNPRVLRSATLPRSISEHVFDRLGLRMAAIIPDETNRSEDIVRVWDQRGNFVSLLKPEGNLKAFAFTPDGRTLVGFLEHNLSGTILRWDLSRPSAPPTQTNLYSEREQGARVETLIPSASAFVTMSSDTVSLAFVSDRQIVLWDVEQGLPLGTLPLPRRMEHIAVSSDGSQILAFDYEGLTIIDINWERLAALACSLAGRALTTDEAKLFGVARAAPTLCERGARNVARQ